MLALLGTVGVPGPAAAEDPPTSRPRITAPEPAEELRPLSPGDTAYTVDAGHVQIETTLAALTIHRCPTLRRTRVYVAPTTLKLGVAQFVDVEVSAEPYYVSVDTLRNVASRAEAYGAVGLAAKLNLYGNDDVTTALALKPHLEYVDGAVEGGLTTLFAAALPGEVAFDAALESDLVKLDSGRYGVEFVTVLTATRDLHAPLAAYVELAATARAYDLGASTLVINAALAYSVGSHAEVNLGASLGAVGDPDDVGFFLSVHARL